MLKSYPKTKKGTAEKQTLLLPTWNHLDTRYFCAKILTLDYLASIREKIGSRKTHPCWQSFVQMNIRKILQRMCSPSLRIDDSKKNKKNIHSTE